MRKLLEVNPNTKDFWDIQYNPNRDYPYKDLNLMYFKYDRGLNLIKPKSKVMDMACGFGIMAEKVKSKFPDCDVYAFDFSDVVDELIKQFPDIHFQKAKIGEEFMPDDFDIIFAFDVLEHLDDPSIVFKDAYKHLKTGGLLVINTPDGDSKPYAGSPEHYWLLNHDDIDMLFADHGFVDVDYPYIPGKEGILFIQAFGVKK